VLKVVAEKERKVLQVDQIVQFFKAEAVEIRIVLNDIELGPWSRPSASLINTSSVRPLVASSISFGYRRQPMKRITSFDSKEI
jgi:hypothetical protein